MAQKNVIDEVRQSASPRDDGARHVLARRSCRVIFCPNQVTATVALGLATRDGGRIDTTVVYWPERCDVTMLRRAGVTCISYSRWNCIRILAMRRPFRRMEVCLPHHKLGRFVSAFALLGSTTSLVDDGLDALRNRPRNVDPARFAKGSPFYTFRYDVPLGDWLQAFSVDRVADIQGLGNVERPSLDLRGVDRLVVESPPLGKVAGQLGVGQPGTLLVTHSNVNKRVLHAPGTGAVDGKSTALERSLASFTGELVVGESMVAVYALLQQHRSHRIVVYLAREDMANLAPLVRLVSSRTHAELRLC